MRRSMSANTTRILLTAALALTTCVSLQLAVAQDDAARNVDKTNYVSKFTSTSGALTDSLIFDNGTNVGIGTTTPATHLHISAADTAANGNRSAIRISNTASTNDRDWWLRVGAPGTNTPDGGFSLGDDDAYWFVITFNGNVGMGLNVTSPTHPLQMADGANEDNGTWNNDSDRNLKEDFAPVDSAQLLAKINAMPIQTWNFKTSKDVRHLGPAAQDFYAAFGLGQDDKHISTVDEGGVALAAVQELYRMVLKGKEEVASLTQANQQKDVQIQNLKAEVAQLHQLEEAVQVLSTKLSKIEPGPENGSNILRAAK